MSDWYVCYVCGNNSANKCACKTQFETLKAENERLRRQIKIIQCDEDGWIKKNYTLTEQLRICKEKAESALPFTQSEIFTLASDWVNKYTEEK